MLITHTIPLDGPARAELTQERGWYPLKRKIIMCISLFAGLAILFYPHVSNYLTEKNGSYAVDSYRDELSKADKARLAKLWKDARDYNENMLGNPVRDPFLQGSGIAMPENYYEVLNVAGIMGSIEIPKISVSLPLYHGTSDKVLKKGVGHLEGSTLPIGGVGTHSVLTGHTGLTEAKLFTDLAELVKGDLFYIHVLDEVLAYKVILIEVIEPNDVDLFRIVPESDLVTLLTCTPYGVNSHRLVLRGKRVPYSPEEKKAIKPKKGLTSEQIAMIKAGVATGVVMISLIIYSVRRRKKREANVTQTDDNLAANKRSSQ